jgi:C4-dicarboxylate-specific signal transduction histidine kinase
MMSADHAEYQTRCGTSTGMRRHLFEPFNANHEAIGVRLWACSHIANKYAWRIAMRSGNGLDRNGSVFTLFLPDAERRGRTGTPSHRLAPAL